MVFIGLIYNSLAKVTMLEVNEDRKRERKRYSLSLAFSLLEKVGRNSNYSK